MSVFNFYPIRVSFHELFRREILISNLKFFKKKFVKPQGDKKFDRDFKNRLCLNVIGGQQLVRHKTPRQVNEPIKSCQQKGQNRGVRARALARLRSCARSQALPLIKVDYYYEGLCNLWPEKARKRPFVITAENYLQLQCLVEHFSLFSTKSFGKQLEKPLSVNSVQYTMYL